MNHADRFTRILGPHESRNISAVAIYRPYLFILSEYSGEFLPERAIVQRAFWPFIIRPIARPLYS
jgi:hypothetical protein